MRFYHRLLSGDIRFPYARAFELASSRPLVLSRRLGIRCCVTNLFFYIRIGYGPSLPSLKETPTCLTCLQVLFKQN